MDNICESFDCFEPQVIYSKLQDDLSKRIYEKRVCFSYTHDYRYVEELSALLTDNCARDSVGKIVRRNLYICYFEIIGEIKKDLKSRLTESARLVVCGASNGYGKDVSLMLSDLEPVLCDKMPKDKVISTLEACELYPDGVFIISSNKYHEEIEEELLANGIKRENIIFIYGSYFLFFSQLKSFYDFYAECNIETIDKTSYLDEPFLDFSDEETFIDCGFFDGLSSQYFIKKVSNHYKKIIAFEPDADKYKLAKQHFTMENIELYNCGCWSKPGEICFKKKSGGASLCTEDGNERIYVDTIDNVLNGRKATYIKMDIEGSELEALKGASNTIQKYRPKLAICIYHKPMDIIEIPLYILSLRSDYKLYLRQYSTNQCDTVLYAIP